MPKPLDPKEKEGMEAFVRAELRWATGVPYQLPQYGFYHFTTIEALLGILSSGCIWATNANHFNDYSELRYGASVLRAHVDRTYALEPHAEGVKLFRAIRNRMRGPMDLSQVFILCLSPIGSDLGMWNLYADRGRGVCLSFAGGDMYRWAAEIRAEFMYVRYDPESLDSFCKRWLLRVRELYLGSWRRGEDPNPDAFAEAFLRDIRSFAPIFKPKIWADEKEWRMVFTRTEGIKKRETGTSYIELSAPPIHTVCLGPNYPGDPREVERELREMGFAGQIFGPDLVALRQASPS